VHEENGLKGQQVLSFLLLKYATVIKFFCVQCPSFHPEFTSVEPGLGSFPQEGWPEPGVEQ